MNNEPRWYCLSTDGMATLCSDEADARKMAEDADTSYPRHAPHRAVQLVDAEAWRGMAAEWLRDESDRLEKINVEIWRVVAARDFANMLEQRAALDEVADIDRALFPNWPQRHRRSSVLPWEEDK